MRKLTLSILAIIMLVGLNFSVANNAEAKTSKTRLCRNANTKLAKETQKIVDFNKETAKREKSILDNASGMSSGQIAAEYNRYFQVRKTELAKLQAKVDKKLVKINKDIKRYCK